MLKYIMSKCGVLMTYELIAEGLPDAASRFDAAEGDKIEQAKAGLLDAIGQCNVKFREPLKTALLGLKPPIVEGEHL